MASRRNRNSAVRGPNSALTDFLRSRGINASEIRARAAAAAAAAEAGAQEADLQGAAGDRPSVSTRTTRRTTVTVSTTTEAGPSTVAPSPRKKSRKRKKLDDEDDNDWTLHTNRAPLPGQISFCAECDCRFTVTAYNRSGPRGEGLLCNACGAQDAQARKAAKKKTIQHKRAKKGTAQRILDGKEGGPRSLRELCINLVAKHIDDVEALGDIGSINMDLICRIIARNRRLNDTTLKLFLDPGSTHLNVYDCSKIDVTGLKMIAAVVSTLNHLSLNFCGRMKDEVLDYYAVKLPELNSLHLGGPFLVTKACYMRFFKSLGPRLEYLTIRDTSAFDVDVFGCLVDSCPNLIELRFGGLSRLDEGCLHLLSVLKKLEVLEIASPTLEITDSAMIDLLNSIGSGLKELNLKECILLTDSFLGAIHACCGRLQILSLEECELITGQGIYDLFTNWTKNFGLTHINLRCVTEASDNALRALLAHSGKRLEALNLNSCGELTGDGLRHLADTLRNKNRLEEVDLGFVRSVNDSVVEGIIEASDVKLVKVWGVPSMTEACAIPDGVTVAGRESDIL